MEVHMNTATVPIPVASPLAVTWSLAGSPWRRLAVALSQAASQRREARHERRMRRIAERVPAHLIEDLGLTQWAPPPRADVWRELDRVRW
jgi:hypothetical protein